MKVDTTGLAAAVDEIREGLTPLEDEVDHRGAVLWTASECLRQIAGLEDKMARFSAVMGKTATMLETQESTPEREAERLRGALDGFKAPPMDLSFLDEDPPWVVMWDGKPRSIHATEEEAQGAVNLYLQDYYRRFQAIPAPLHPILQVGKDIGP
jgi:hypothetical protein